MENLGWGLQMTVLGMGLVFALLAAAVGLARPGAPLRRTAGAAWPARPQSKQAPAEAPATDSTEWTPDLRRRDHRRRADAPGRAPPPGRAGDAQLLAGQPAVRLALGGDRARAPEPQLAAGKAHDATLHARRSAAASSSSTCRSSRADRFEVVVGDERYEVALSGDEDLPEATITPALRAGARRAAAATPVRGPQRRPAASLPPAVPNPARGGGGVGALNAPMPGMILEVSVAARRHGRARPGDRRPRSDEDEEHHQVAPRRNDRRGVRRSRAGGRPRRRDRPLREG